MTHAKIVEENKKEDFIEVIAETELDSGETKQNRFKFSKRQMKDGTYKDGVRAWAIEVHENYEELDTHEGEEIEF